MAFSIFNPNALDPNAPPVFTRDQIQYAGPSTSYTPGYGDAGGAGQSFNVPGAWQLNTGDPNFNWNNVYFRANPATSNDPNSATFDYGIKSGHDQGTVYSYKFDPASGNYVPVASTGTIGGRGGIFDSNAFTRDSNRDAAIVAAYALASYGAGSAGLFGGEGAGAASSSPEYLSAADQAGGLLPQYGTNAGYEAGLSGASGAAPAATTPTTSTPSSPSSPSTPSNGNNPLGNLKGSDYVKLGTTLYGALQGKNGQSGTPGGYSGPANPLTPLSQLGYGMGAPSSLYGGPALAGIPPQYSAFSSSPAASLWQQYASQLSNPYYMRQAAPGMFSGGQASPPVTSRPVSSSGPTVG